MSDLVQRLRGLNDGISRSVTILEREVCGEAADRIEALEAALRMVIDNVETGSYESTGQAIDKARAALAPEPEK